ncbi:hypothetical protein CDD83_473 [Cordyceps sp. RAO-2017]|nr:hypothetical protein CDD83_473 [Cordyceps sp. RAO-2017]
MATPQEEAPQVLVTHPSRPSLSAGDRPETPAMPSRPRTSATVEEEGEPSEPPPSRAALLAKSPRQQATDGFPDQTPAEARQRSRAMTEAMSLGYHHDSSESESDSESDYDEKDEAAQRGRQPASGAAAAPAAGARRQSSNKGERCTGPAHDKQYRWLRHGGLKRTTTGAKKDGRLPISVKDTAHTGYIAKAVGRATQRMMTTRPNEQQQRPATAAAGADSDDEDEYGPLELTGKPSKALGLKLNIVIMVIGSRGDAQPFVRIGKFLKEHYGHRVRLATHPAFRDFVESEGLEFFSVGGDPSELMAYMVKNPGMIPKLETVKAGEIGRRRLVMAKMFDGFWRSCVEATDGDRPGETGESFVADTIIANPPSFAHIHCAEALGIPLHLVFTFPYTPTHQFPHPLAKIKQREAGADARYANFISYPLVEMMVWQGLGDLVNDFRVKTLCLDPVSTLWAPGATYRLHVPYTYLWSPGLVPKPPDWGDEIDVSGFVFLEQGTRFTPPQSLLDFLDAGDTPIYIGFGSIVIDDADKFTSLIFDAVNKAGVRALVSKGWGGLGSQTIPENIYMLESIPHDWLFPRVKACVIHGGAGTTAIALKNALPTMVVPFFGDQHFWGGMLGRSGAGPEPVPYRELDSDKLAAGIEYCLSTEARTAAQKIADQIERDGDGAINAVRSLHRHVLRYGPKTLCCSILPDHYAVWRPKKNPNVRLSPLAAQFLVAGGLLSWKKLRLLRHVEWNDFEGPGEPLTGVVGSIASTLSGLVQSVGGAPIHLGKTAHSRFSHRLERRRTRREDIDKAKRKKKQKEKADPASADDSSDDTPSRASSPGPSPKEYLRDISGSVRQTAWVLAKAPADLFLALAQGIHNAPRLYGDETVRRPTRVKGIHSGLVASRREFVYGIYDAVTGVVRLPVRGAKSHGATGFAKGVGMGVTGFVLKGASAVVGPIGFTLQGVVKQAERHRMPYKRVRRSRVAQGEREARAI